MFHLFHSYVATSVFILQVASEFFLDVAYIFTHMMQVFYLDVAYVYNGFKCFSVVFASVSDARFKCFICFHAYVTIVASGYFKTRSGVASFSSSLYCLASMSGARSEHMQRRSPLAWVGPTCLRASAVGHTWAGRCRKRDGGSGAGVWTGASVRTSGR